MDSVSHDSSQTVFVRSACFFEHKNSLNFALVADTGHTCVLYIMCSKVLLILVINQLNTQIIFFSLLYRAIDLDI